MTLPDPSAFIAAGASAQVYRLPEGRVIKLFHDGIDPGIVGREYAIARAVQTTGLPVPHVFGLERRGERQGIIYGEMRGPNLLSYIRRQPMRSLWALDQMARLQKAMQDCHVVTLRSRKAILAEDIGMAPIAETVRGAAIRRLEQLEEGDRLTHGDLHPGNLIVTDTGVSVIDWSRAARGTAASDLVRTEMVMRFGHVGGGRKVSRMDAAARDWLAGWYLRRHAALTGLDREALHAWRALVALAWTRMRPSFRDEAFAAYLAAALRAAGLPKVD